MNRNMGPNEGRRIKSLGTTFAIIDRLKSVDQARVTELADDLNTSKATIHTHLATLMQEGYVVKNGVMYGLNLQFLKIGGRVRNNHSLYLEGKLPADKLAEDTRELVHLATEHNGEVIYLYKVRGDNAIISAVPTGSTRPMHATAAGKVMLAFLSPEYRDQILLQSQFKRLTVNTISDRETLDKQIEEIRKTGIAINNEEAVRGSRSVAAPVLRPDGGVIGAILVSGPTARMEGNYLEELQLEVNNAANQIEINIQI